MSPGAWVPIGNAAAPFAGKFDGQNHAIVTLTPGRSVPDGTTYSGLFGFVQSVDAGRFPATLQNLQLTLGAYNLTSTDTADNHLYAGGIQNSRGALRGSQHTEGSTINIGGAVGRSHAASLLNVSGLLSGSSTVNACSMVHLGGLAGCGTGIIRCHGAVTATDLTLETSQFGVSLGGLVGDGDYIQSSCGLLDSSDTAWSLSATGDDYGVCVGGTVGGIVDSKRGGTARDVLGENRAKLKLAAPSGAFVGGAFGTLPNAQGCMGILTGEVDAQGASSLHVGTLTGQDTAITSETKTATSCMGGFVGRDARGEVKTFRIVKGGTANNIGTLVGKPSATMEGGAGPRGNLFFGTPTLGIGMKAPLSPREPPMWPI